MELKDAITLLMADAKSLCQSEEPDCPRCQAVQLVGNAFGIDIQALADTSDARKFVELRQKLEPRLVHLIAGLRQHQVVEAVSLLLDYIDLRVAAK